MGRVAPPTSFGGITGYLFLPEDLVRRESEATNKFFEARVAVMGYKCRNMQLQGELESKKGDQVGGAITMEQTPTGVYGSCAILVLYRTSWLSWRK